MRKNLFLMLIVGLSAFIFSTTASAQQKFTVSLNGVQENPPVNSPGGGSCVLTLDTAETQITLSCTYSGLGSNASAAHIHTNGPVGVNGPVLFNLTGASGTSGTLTLAPTAVTPAQVADLRAKRWYVNIHTTNFPDGEIRGQIKIATTPFDFDGDGRTDIRVLRAADNGFYTLNSKSNSMSFNTLAGSSTLNSANDDYDGDGRGDFVTFFTSGTARIWRILQTGSNTVREVHWGLTTDQLVPADYDGDGKTDIAVFRRSEGIWFILQSTTNQMRAEYWGQQGASDLGKVGDFDKDGKNDLTVIRPTANGTAWFTRRSSDGAMNVVFWGGVNAPATDSFFPPTAQMDIDGDGRQDHMVVRDPNNDITGTPVTFYIRRSSDGQMFVLQWGLDTDERLFGDYDGDGKTDIVARRNEGGKLIWYIYQSSNGQLRAVHFGAAGDL
jgi:CHRD domain/FG-GAP-like repeat